MTFAFDKNILVFSPNLFEERAGKHMMLLILHTNYLLDFYNYKNSINNFWSIQVNNRSIAILVLPNPCS